MRNPIPSLVRSSACVTLLFGAVAAVSAQTVFPTNPAGRQDLVAGIDVLASAKVPAGKVELFDGKTFEGWSFHFRTNADPAQTWTITNGVIHCSGQPYGYIRTEQPYRDYKLTVEWRFVKVAPRADNTGVLLHVQPPDQVWPRAIECQGQSRRQGDLILMGGTSCKVNGETKTGGRIAMQGEPNEKAVGEWNIYEIVCAGDTLKASVNGKLLNDVTECSVKSGFIAIQSEGSEIEIRRVTLEPAR